MAQLRSLGFGAFALALSCALLWAKPPGQPVTSWNKANPPTHPNVKKLCDAIKCIQDSDVKQKANNEKNNYKIFTPPVGAAGCPPQTSSYTELFSANGKTKVGCTGFLTTELCDPNPWSRKAVAFEEVFHRTQKPIHHNPGNSLVQGKEPKDFDIDGVLFTANESYLEVGAKIATIADLKKNSNSDANKTKEINKLKNDAGLAYTGLCGALIRVMNKAGGMAGLTAAQQQSFKDFVGCKQAAKKAGIVAVRRKKAAK